MKAIASGILSIVTILSLASCSPPGPLRPPAENNRHLLSGENSRHRIAAGETLVELAVKSGLGYQSLVNANPGIDPWLPPEGQEVLLPYATLLPAKLQNGITVNLAEYRLFYVSTEGSGEPPKIYPIGIADKDSTTPEGNFTIRNKVQNPTWKVPRAIRRERRLPATLPPGPDNPLGEFWLGFSRTGHGIHGTNDPFGIGRRASRGCIRLYPQDIRELFTRVQVGTPVRIIYQPIKLAVVAGELLMEVHPDFLGRQHDQRQELQQLLATLDWQGEIDQEAMTKALREGRGIPVRISPAPRRSPWPWGRSVRTQGGMTSTKREGPAAALPFFCLLAQTQLESAGRLGSTLLRLLIGCFCTLSGNFRLSGTLCNLLSTRFSPLRCLLRPLCRLLRLLSRCGGSTPGFDCLIDSTAISGRQCRGASSQQRNHQHCCKHPFPLGHWTTSLDRDLSCSPSKQGMAPLSIICG